MTADALIAAAMEAQSRNRDQHLLIANPSEEIDSLVEHVNALAKTATSEQRPHVHALITLIRKLCESNLAERDCERMIAGAVEALKRADSEWTFRRVVRELREPLAVLTQRVYGEARRREAREQVMAVIRDAPRGLLVVGDNVNPRLVHELRVRKSTVLWSLILDAGAPKPHKVKPVTYLGGRGSAIGGLSS